MEAIAITTGILVEREAGLMTITLNREHAANSLNRGLLLELGSALGEAAASRQVRSVIITGAGDKAFCAGADLKERKEMDDEDTKRAVSLIKCTINQIEAMPQPVIAAINGAAFGGGLELALACDFRLAADHARFGLTETSLGIIPGAGGTQRLPRLIGIQKAKELIFTAKRITAEEAESLGLILKAVPQDSLMEEARQLAGLMMANGPVAIRQAKKAIRLGMETDLQTGLEIEELAYNETIPTKDRKEGLAAFAEKRKPVFSGE